MIGVSLGICDTMADSRLSYSPGPSHGKPDIGALQPACLASLTKPSLTEENAHAWGLSEAEDYPATRANMQSFNDVGDGHSPGGLLEIKQILLKSGL